MIVMGISPLSFPQSTLLFLIVGLLFLELLTEFAVCSNLLSMFDEEKRYEAHQCTQNSKQSASPVDAELGIHGLRCER